jgi:hypothetical protein
MVVVAAWVIARSSVAVRPATMGIGTQSPRRNPVPAVGPTLHSDPTMYLSRARTWFEATSPGVLRVASAASVYASRAAWRWLSLPMVRAGCDRQGPDRPHELRPSPHPTRVERRSVGGRRVATTAPPTPRVIQGADHPLCADGGRARGVERQSPVEGTTVARRHRRARGVRAQGSPGDGGGRRSACCRLRPPPALATRASLELERASRRPSARPSQIAGRVSSRVPRSGA